MITTTKPNKGGTRRAGARVALAVAAAANALPLFQVSNLAAQVGVKMFKLKRLFLEDVGAGGTLVHIGAGVGPAFVEAMPAIRTVNNMNGGWSEYDVPEVEFAADMTAYPDAATVNAQVEVEESG